VIPLLFNQNKPALKMTTEQLKEANRLNSLIDHYESLQDRVNGFDPLNLAGEIAQYFREADTLIKKQMTQVVVNAILESCEACISSARKQFENI
jgi:hypothetical protein